uniref:Uncharacterized protein n=1 Tax=Parascaris univalens TaxID=6257 RepID=A0A915A9V4_PARUN
MRHRGSLQPACSKKGLTASSAPMTSGSDDTPSGNDDTPSRNWETKTRRFNGKKVMLRASEEMKSEVRQISGICPSKSASFGQF